jgi:hypothetical protein
MDNFREILESRLDVEFNVLLPGIGSPGVRVRIVQLGSDFVVLERVASPNIRFFMAHQAVIIAA